MSSTTKFTDVFTLLQETSQKCLNDDKPMISSEDFSLFDSMSAVVIMDKQMDPCSGISVSSSFDAFLEESYKEAGRGDDRTAVLVLQELFRREVAFIDGASLLESLHQSLHMWPHTWSLLSSSSSSSSCDQWLSTYAQSVVAASTVFLRLVTTADIFEDEDFQFQSRVSAFLSQDEMMTLNEQVKVISSKEGKDGAQVSGYVSKFFKFRSLLFQLYENIDELVSFSSTLPLTTRGNSSPQQLAQLMSNLSSQGEAHLSENEAILQRSLEKVYGIAKTLSEVIADMSSSADTTPPATSEEQIFLDRCFRKSFMNIQQSSPARAFPLLSFQESLKYVQDMCEDLLCVCTSLNTMLFHTENIDIDTLFQWFMAFSRNKSNVLVRSYLLASWTFVKPNTNVFLLNSCDSRGVPTSFLTNDTCSEWLKSSVSFLVWDTMKVLTIHRNKIQMKWESMFSRWGNFVNEAQYVDRVIAMNLLGDTSNPSVEQPNAQPWFSMWALNLMTSIMDVYMELYMELDLLTLPEISGYYWYWDYILSTKGYALKTLRELQNAMKNRLHEMDVKDAKDALAKAKASGCGKKSKKSKEALNAAKIAYNNILAVPPPIPAAYSTEEIYVVLKGQMQKALFRLYMGFDEGGVIQPAQSHYSSPEYLFAGRYRAFFAITNPAPIGYDDFLATKRASSAEFLQPSSLFASADGMLKTLKTLVERAKSAIPPGLSLSNEPGRLPRCVCRSATPAISKLTLSQKFPYESLTVEGTEPLQTSAVFLQDMMSLFEGQTKVGVALSLACTRQLQRLDAPPPPGGSRLSHRVSLDRKFSDYFPVPSVEVLMRPDETKK